MALKLSKLRVYRNGENYNTALADVIEKPVFIISYQNQAFLIW